MIDVNKAITARYTKEGRHFEILVDCENALAYKAGKLTDLEDVLATKDIFMTVRSAEHAAETDLKIAFGTTDPYKVADMIIKHGEIQLTTEHKHKLREQKKRQLITLIHQNAINPQTGHPHPADRIERALEEAHAHIDEFTPAEQQLKDITKKLTAILPLRFETRTLEILIPAEYANQSFHILKAQGKLLQEHWNTQGSLVATLEIPAGMQEELENKLNALTHGNVAITIKKGEQQ